MLRASRSHTELVILSRGASDESRPSFVAEWSRMAAFCGLLLKAIEKSLRCFIVDSLLGKVEWAAVRVAGRLLSA